MGTSERWAVDSSFLPMWQRGGEWQSVGEVAEGLGKEWPLIEGFWGISSALCGELSLTKHWGHGEIASWDLLLWAKEIPKYFSKVHTSDESRLGLVRGKGQGGHISR